MGFKIIDSGEERNIMHAGNMKPGQIARVVSNDACPECIGHIVMRNFIPNRFELMDLSEPIENSGWASADCDMEVELLKPGTRLILEITGDNE